MEVITYGTWDLFHEDHVRLLRRGKALGDHLTVGVTTENYDDARDKLNMQQSLIERIRNVQDSGLADEVIMEEYEGQKANDLRKYLIDVFAVGSDWTEKFDHLKDYCEVVYLERTEGVCSIALRAANYEALKLGAADTGRIAHRFMEGSHFVSGFHVEAVCISTYAGAKAFREHHTLKLAAPDHENLQQKVDVVYTATPHECHFDYALQVLSHCTHVLCEKPLTVGAAQTKGLYDTAGLKGLVLLEAAMTTYSPTFQRLVAVARSGSIGNVKAVDATSTERVSQGREPGTEHEGGNTDLASYPRLTILKLLGRGHRPGCAHLLAAGRGQHRRHFLAHRLPLRPCGGPSPGDPRGKGRRRRHQRRHAGIHLRPGPTDGRPSTSRPASRTHG